MMGQCMKVSQMYDWIYDFERLSDQKVLYRKKMSCEIEKQ